MWFYRLLRLNSMFHNHRIKLAGVGLLNALGMRHLCVRLDPTMRCNLRCLMCGSSIEDDNPKYKMQFTMEETSHIMEIFLPYTLQFYLGCQREPTMYKQFPEIVRMAKRQYGVPMVGLVTNGQLLTRDHLLTLAEHGLDELTLSVHGIERETFERFMPPGKFDKHVRLMEEVKTLRESREKVFRLRINYVVNQDTLHELPRVLDVYSKYRIDVIQVRPMKVRTMLYEKGGLDEQQLHAYRQTVNRMRQQARDLGIVFIANDSGVYAKKAGDSAIIQEEIAHFIAPPDAKSQRVHWWEETYPQYCRRTKWYRRVARKCLTSRQVLCEGIESRLGFLDYDIS
jgi:MoaA/NifB/PqqE/SkfB family radical SAM enzyme